MLCLYNGKENHPYNLSPPLIVTRRTLLRPIDESTVERTEDSPLKVLMAGATGCLNFAWAGTHKDARPALVVATAMHQYSYRDSTCDCNPFTNYPALAVEVVLNQLSSNNHSVG